MAAFHRRFRASTSNAASDSLTSTERTDPAPPMSKAEASRSAKRFLLSTIRDDWTFSSPEPPPAQDPLHRKPLDYRTREEWSSDPEPLSDEQYDARDPMVFTDSDPYKFESPDAVATTIVDRKRKRRTLLREELGWNSGLRDWVDRRNAWCGARKQGPGTRRAKIHDDQEKNGHGASLAMDLPGPLSPLSAISATSSSSSSPPQSAPESEDDDDGETTLSPDDPDPILPVYPPLLPDNNSIRASIRPTMYPAIYSKVVLQSLTPTVPVPLPDMIGALVQGWKSEGNWPPKSAGPAATFIIQEGGRRASELLKFRRRENIVVEKGRMRKGVGAVKKVLGLRPFNAEADDAGSNLDDDYKGNGGIGPFGLVGESTRDPI